MAKPKLYTSEQWLRNEYLIKHKTVDQIAAEQGVAKNTIRNALKKFNLIR